MYKFYFDNFITLILYFLIYKNKNYEYIVYFLKYPSSILQKLIDDFFWSLNKEYNFRIFDFYLEAVENRKNIFFYAFKNFYLNSYDIIKEIFNEYKKFDKDNLLKDLVNYETFRNLLVEKITSEKQIKKIPEIKESFYVKDKSYSSIFNKNYISNKIIIQFYNKQFFNDYLQLVKQIFQIFYDFYKNKKQEILKEDTLILWIKNFELFDKNKLEKILKDPFEIKKQYLNKTNLSYFPTLNWIFKTILIHLNRKYIKKIDNLDLYFTKPIIDFKHKWKFYIKLNEEKIIFD